ncbi:MAG: hypothetical protein SCH98_05800 [Deferrisomatales bacterium]|nr:hypothetical protein [Deferrisomatales bacterium]
MGSRLPRDPDPPTTEEKLGHLWAAIFLAMVLVLVAVLAGRGCLAG